MFVSTSRLRTLAEYSMPETTASAEDVETFMLVLWDEASQEGRDAYTARLGETTPGEYPWSAVRAREYELDSSAWGDLEKLITYAPPALSLALARRKDIEPELPGDELPDAINDGPYERVFGAWWHWDPATVVASTTPLGWTVPETEADVRLSDNDVDAFGQLFAESAEAPLHDAPPIIPTITGPAATGASPSTHSPSPRVTWDDAAPWVLGGGVVLAAVGGVYVVSTATPSHPALDEGGTK